MRIGIFGMWIGIGLSAAVVLGVLGHVGESQVTQGIAQSVLYLTAGVAAATAVALWASSRPAYRVCNYCHTSVVESEGYDCAGRRFACHTCCATDARAVVVTPKEAA